jgi:glucose-1-phosphate cytidylyltransferase
MHSRPPVVLLCGGLGLRQRTDDDDAPKPLRRLSDGRPLLLHVIDFYRAFDLDEFVLCVGYGAPAIQSALATAYGVAPGEIAGGEGWGQIQAGGVRITMVDSGVAAGKCVRLLDGRRHLGQRPFVLGYADVLSDFDLRDLVARHRDTAATLTLVGTRVRSRYGEFVVGGGSKVTAFAEKPLQPALVSAGYFMCAPTIWADIAPGLSFERDVVPRLVARGVVSAVVHDGLWLALDTYKDFVDADALMESEGCPWLTPA